VLTPSEVETIREFVQVQAFGIAPRRSVRGLSLRRLRLLPGRSAELELQSSGAASLGRWPLPFVDGNRSPSF